jgi:signal transduction histidine kinase/BarA-like signal transduction histidine kinase
MPQYAHPSGKINQLLDDAYAARINDLHKSLSLTEEALAISKESGNRHLLAKCLSKLSLFNMIKGNFDLSMKQGNQAIELFQEFQDEKGIADAKYNIAGLHYKTDNFHLGLVYLIDCLEIYRKTEDYHNQARVQKSLGTIYEYFGDEKSAVLSYEQAIADARIVKDLNLESNAYNPLSGIYLNQNRIEDAADLIDKSMQMKKQTGDVRGLAFALYGLAKIYAKRAEYGRAEQTFLEANAIHEKMGEKLGTGMCFHKLGELYFSWKKYDQAKESLQKAIDFANENNIALIKYKCNYLMYALYKELGDHTTALKYLEIYLKEKEAVINTQTQKIIESYEAITRMDRLEKEAQMQREKAEILEKKNRAEESSRVKQEFLSNMSHELRTPLNAVITITSLLEEKYKNTDNQLIESLKFSSNNLLLIINDILDFSKLDLGKVKLEYQSTNLRDLLANIRNAYSSLADEKGLKLNLEIAPEVRKHFMVDKTKLSQILGNLISNAIKFTEKGNIDVCVKLVESSVMWDQIEFSVYDTGIGVAEHFKEEIFESFSQQKSYTTKKHVGSGLGLAIVKKLVNLHGSNIEVESTEGAGSRFYFQLSLKHGDTPTNALPLPIEKLAGKSVLLAEDNMINAMVALKLLRNWKLETTHAKNGVLAVDISKNQTFDYILMDIHMPEMDGFDAARLIRTTQNLNNFTPIFALTADVNAQEHTRYAEYFNGFLLKPIERDKLFKAMEDFA